MDSQSTNEIIVLDSNWSQKELELLAKSDTEGAKPIAPSLAAQMMALFLEGYSCAEIAKQNKGLNEIDILVCRKKYSWDEEKERYSKDLMKQIREKLAKQKLESLEFLTNMMAITHKEHKEKALRYLQTGKEEDKPDSWAKSPKAYKEIIEAIQKLTGEDRVTTQRVTSESTLTVQGTVQTAIPIETQSKLLKKLAGKSEKNE